MTRAGVLKLGLGLLLAGGVGFWLFKAAGFEGFSAGIAAEAVLVVIVVGWTGSYLFRVVTGQMTYMQQRQPQLWLHFQWRWLLEWLLVLVRLQAYGVL